MREFIATGFENDSIFLGEPELGSKEYYEEYGCSPGHMCLDCNQGINGKCKNYNEIISRYL